MRLFRLCTNSQLYLDRFHDQQPELEGRPYIEQYRKLMKDCYGWADFWTHGFSPLGYEVWEPVGNAVVQQKQWALEHDVEYSEKWLFEISLSQIKDFAPDVLLVNDHHTFGKSFLDRVRESCPSIKLIIGWCGAPYTSLDVFKAYDLTLSNVSSLLDVFHAKGLNSRLFRHGFSATVNDRLATVSDRGPDVSFVGSAISADQYHTSRLELLEHLSHNSALEIWSPNGKVLQGGGIASSIIHGAVFGLDMYRTLAKSFVTLNTHIDISLTYASNMRLFEATGVGACLLTDWTPNLSELFEEDVEVVTFRTAEEAVEKMDYLMAHPSERDSIAEAGQKRTLAEHSFTQRAKEMDELIRNELA
ncbi:hypothetical protein SYK_24310 [Pseudodesulfovibrio nedwellii]|uniref:Spore protein YkvP/CgeB glycosyl transferase-like domain-containing protein n=1 Tax=Pseudodesulfovibrio nedwellii TaxID=2973072 RepID=A0ABN6S7H5_9BACT|nr:glycosyltransferase [Pseudodesulfovibrio nedwellii]BDQ38071.1 hypothetical protein SYK_24310 [Pseudodesulfovibrio nedwellii]